MLVLHPSSRCDVCLDPYSWDTPAQSPHAIPCGHIFCKTCLEAVSPSSCPLCRKAFLPDRIKKLHVDKPENVDQGEENREIELLRSLCLIWGENTPDEDIEALTGEVGTYLESKADDTCLPLRKAKDGILVLQKFKKKREKDRAALSKMTRLLSTAIERAEEDNKLSKSIEETLLLKIDILTSQHSECEATIEKLKTDLAKFQHTSNPLPKPPEPIPLDRFPPFARAAAAGLRSVSDPHVPPSPKHHTGSSSTDLSSNSASTSTRPSAEYVSPDPTTLAEIAARDRESAEKLQAEEAQKRERIAQRKQKQPLYNIYRYPTDPDPNGKRSDVIPGASPNQRVIPAASSSRLSQDVNWGQSNGSSSADINTLDPSAPASAYVAGYASGYGYGYHYAPSMKTAASHDGVMELSSIQSSLPEATPRVGLGLYGVPAAPAESMERLAAYNILQPPPNPSSSSATGTRTHSRRRSRRDSITTDGHVTDSTITLSSSSSGTHTSRSRRRSTQVTTTQPTQPSLEAPLATPASDRGSISSWGTVRSQQVPGSSGSSVADLGLQWFPPGTGARTSISSDSSRNPYFPFASTRQSENGAETAGSSAATSTASVDATPRASDHIRPAVADPLQTLSMLLETNTGPGSRHARVVIEDRPRPSRHTTVPEPNTTRDPNSSLASSDIQLQTSGGSGDRHSRRRQRHRRGSTTTGTRPNVDVSAPSAPPLASAPVTSSSMGVVDEGYLSDAPQPTGQSFGNALGLDLTEEPQSAGLVISAPTPIVSTRNFLRSWSYDH